MPCRSFGFAGSALNDGSLNGEWGCDQKVRMTRERPITKRKDPNSTVKWKLRSFFSRLIGLERGSARIAR